MKMKIVMGLVMALFAMSATADRILWAALDEASVVDGTAFRQFTDASGTFINAARLSVRENGGTSYSMDSIIQLALWIPNDVNDPWYDESLPAPGYWENEHPEVCLRDEDGEYEMGQLGNQFYLGSDPASTSMIFFELGNIADWNDLDSPFVTLAYAAATISELEAAKHMYTTFDINPPVASDWMPTQFHAVPEPSIAILALLGTCLLFKRRKTIHA